MKLSSVTKILPILALGFLFQACAGNAEGTIFLDENGNNIKDGSDANIASLTFTVTKDDEEIQSGVTDAEGKFEVELDGAGTYCVEVSSADLEASQATVEAALTAGSSNLQSSTGGEGLRFATITPNASTTMTTALCSDDINNEGDGGTIGEEGKDCSDSACDALTICIETNCDDNQDNDGNGLTDCDDTTDCGSNAACADSSGDDGTDTTATVESGKACNESNGFVLELDVPIALDYEAGLESVDDEPYTVSRGESVDVDVVYPQSCTLGTISIPSKLELPSGTTGYTTSGNLKRFDLNEYIQDEDVDIDILDSDIISIDSLGVVTFTVTASQIGIGEATASFTPTATCPDKSTVTLAKHTFTIDSEDDFTITLNWEDDDAGNDIAEAEDLITVTATITNNSNTAYTADEVDFTFTLPTNTSNNVFIFDDDHCDGATANAPVCEFAIPANSAVEVEGTFQLPTTISASPNNVFTSTGSLKITKDGSSETWSKSDSLTAL